MTLKKGGGRESGGDTQGRTGSGRSRSGVSAPPVTPGSQAAAKPAALHPCPDCDPLHEQYRERIRALEAELAEARFKIAYYKPLAEERINWKGHSDTVETRNAALEKERDALKAVNERLRKEAPQ